jgi:hypothetical protein
VIKTISPKFCIICRRPAGIGTAKMFPLEKPYANFFLHINCIEGKSSDDILEIIKNWLNKIKEDEN